MSKKSKIWILVLGSVCLACAALWLALRFFGAGTVAVISVNGEKYTEIDLSRVTEKYDIQIDTQYGHNTVHVAPGAIAVTESSCPDHICQQQGSISKSGIPIICMPNRLVIEIEGGNIDA